MPDIGRIFSKAVVPAIGAAFVEEWLFRGLLLGLWLRVVRPVAACLGSALMFSLLHFLDPPPGTVFANAADPLAGFQLLGAMLGHLGDPLFHHRLRDARRCGPDSRVVEMADRSAVDGGGPACRMDLRV